MRKISSLLFLFLLVIAFLSLSSVVAKSVQAAGPSCGPQPAAPKVWAKSGPSPGQVTLYWDSVVHANRYAVAYGTEMGKYIYGADNIGNENSRSYTVGSLQPGVKYYFRLAAARNKCSSPFSTEVSAIAKPGQVSASTSAASVVDQPQPVSSLSGPVGKQMLWAKSGPGIGEVTLYWQHADNADNYHLVYGTEHGKFKYGALNIGKINNFTVRSLVPGKLYHLALVPLVGNRAIYTTEQVMIQAKAPVTTQVQISRTDSSESLKQEVINQDDDKEAVEGVQIEDTGSQTSQGLEQEVVYDDGGGQEEDVFTEENFNDADVGGVYQEDTPGY